MIEDVPLGWTVVDAGQLIERIDSGKSEQTLDRRPEPDECGVVKVSAVTWGSFDPREAKAVLPGRFLKAAAVNAGDLLLSRANTAELVGAAVLVERAFPNLMLSDKILRLHLRDDVVDKRFMLAALRRREARDYFADQASGTSDSMRNVSQEKLRSLEVPLAPLNEQRRIVAKLDALLGRSKKAREHLDRIPALLDALKRSILATAFRGDLTADWRKANPHVEPASKLLERIRAERRRRWEEELRAKGKDPKKAKYEEPAPVGESDLPELPEGWCWASLDELAVDGPTNGYSPATSSDATGTLSLKLTATTGGALRLDESTTKRLHETIAAASPFWLRPGDVLVQRANTVEYVGTAAVFTGPLKTYVYPDLMMRIRVAVVEPQWIADAVNNLRLAGYFSARATGTAGSMPKINGQLLRAVPVPVPPTAERAAIRRCVEHAMQRVTATSRLADRLLRLLDGNDRSVLGAAFRGELVPQDPDDEPADVMLARLRASTPVPAAKAPRAAPRAKRSPGAAQEAAPSSGDALDVVVGALVAAKRMTAEQVRAATGLGKDDVTPVLKGLVAAGKVRVEGKARGTAYVWALEKP